MNLFAAPTFRPVAVGFALLGGALEFVALWRAHLLKRLRRTLA